MISKTKNQRPLIVKDGMFIEELVELFRTARSPEDMSMLLQAILTPEELQQIKRRWQIVKYLIAGKTIRETAELLKISVAKVSRGSREIKYGNGIFQKLFKKIYK